MSNLEDAAVRLKPTVEVPKGKMFRRTKRPGRNDPCPKHGVKYKKCPCYKGTNADDQTTAGE